MTNYSTTEFLSAKNEQALIVDWQNHRKAQAGKTIINSFQPLLNNVLKRYRYYGIALEDLYQEASLGLCRALDGYDPNKGVRFSHYAKLWMNAYCQDYVMRNWSIVRVGTTNIHKKLFFQLRYIKRKLETVEKGINEEQSDMHKIAHALQTSIHEVRAMHERLNFKDRYLDDKISENSLITYTDILPSNDLSQEYVLLEEEQNTRCQTILQKAEQILNERELDILYKHRLSEPAFTLDEISFSYGISRERVRQIELNSLRKLKKALMTAKIHSFNKI